MGEQAASTMGEDSRSSIAEAQGSSEVAPLNERLTALVVKAIDVLSEDKRTVRGKVRTGEEIARAIPDQAAFLAEVDQMKDGKFFELNEKGQLVMQDGCAEAYGLRDDFPPAQKRQKRLVYRNEAGKIQVLGGVNFTVDKETGDRVLPDNKGRIPASSILMERGLPTLTWDAGQYNAGQYLGEYARMNTFKIEGKIYTWIDDETLDPSHTRYAAWSGNPGRVYSGVHDSDFQYGCLGSRGVLRVNLNLNF
ncbi:MAG: hypothetical protein ACD_28C00426G0002 [uncultured bacterium]|nr:MAG: hypothetical protein ACD_28C00426G0002 [uncultured bacterium]